MIRVSLTHDDLVTAIANYAAIKAGITRKDNSFLNVRLEWDPDFDESSTRSDVACMVDLSIVSGGTA